MNYCDYCVCRCLSVFCISPAWLCVTDRLQTRNCPIFSMSCGGWMWIAWLLGQTTQSLFRYGAYSCSANPLSSVFTKMCSVFELSRVEPVLWTRAAMLCRITPHSLCSPTLMRTNCRTQPPSPVSVCLQQTEIVFLFLSLKILLICRLHCNKWDFCACRVDKTPGQLWAVRRRDRTSHNRGADRD